MPTKIGFVEAFKKFNAKLDNPMWAVSSISDKGEFVLSCWSQYFERGEKGVLRYVDRLSRWTGNTVGNNLLKSHLVKAHSEALPVRLVIATAESPEEVESVDDASKIKKTFSVREDLVGRVTSFDGDNFVIEYRTTP
jgi:hypothetical protein